MSANASPSKTSRFSRIDPVALGILCSFAASMAYGLGTVIAGKAVIHAPPIIAATVSLVAGVVTMALFSAKHAAKDLRASRSTYFNLTMAGIFAVCGIVLLYTALTLAPVAVVSPVSSLSPMFSLVFSHFFLQRLEKVTLKVVAGTALVLMGVVMITLGGTG